jgi:hypothetical protein
MPNVFSDISNGYRKVNKAFDQASLIILILSVGFLIIYAINNPNKKTGASDNSNFKCAVTAQDKLLYPDTSALKTATQLALINPDTEIFTTDLGKNDIPAITEPIFVSSKVVSPCITDNEPVLILKIQNEVRIYPRQILNYHIAVNDKIGDLSVLVTYSPLADHFQVFNRDIKGEPLMFGIAGSLYKNSDLLFDTKTESLWSQYDGRALVGNMIGAKLDTIPFAILPFTQALKLYPNAKVLSFQTGYQRDYSVDPFIDYRINDEVVGKVTYSDTTLSKKTDVYGFQYGGKFYALVQNEINNVNDLTFIINKNKFSFDIKDGQAVLTNTTDKSNIPLFTSYWFVWYDFHPDTEIINF